MSDLFNRKIELDDPVDDYKDSGFDSNLDRRIEEQIMPTRNSMQEDSRNNFNITNVKSFQIFGTGQTFIKGSEFSATVNHNLGYAPAFLSYAKCDGVALPEGYSMLPYLKNDGIANPRVVGQSNEVNLVFSRNFIGSNDLTIYFIVFREKTE